MRCTVLYLLLVQFADFISASKFRKLPAYLGFTVPEMIESHGYPVEIHHITTDDGYILEYHRVPHGLNNTKLNTRRPPILLMHGYTLCSVQDFAQGPKRALGYMLADAGYDVWAANARGNHYSKKHLHLHPRKDLDKFYNFTFHEVGHYDIPAAIDYILNITGHKKMFYFGNSMGGTIFLTFGASRPEYSKKIKLAVIASPAAYMKHDNNLRNWVEEYYDRFMYFLKAAHLWSVDWTTARNAFPELFKMRGMDDTIVNIMNEILMNRDDAESIRPYLGAYLSNWPSDTALKNLAHYLQFVKDGTFGQFDYGMQQNLMIYGSAFPPQYNLSYITCPVAVYYAKADWVVPYKEQIKLKKSLPNLVYDYVETTGRYNHLSFGAAADCPNRIWKDIIRLLGRYK